MFIETELIANQDAETSPFDQTATPIQLKSHLSADNNQNQINSKFKNQSKTPIKPST